jgi:hypothetical protein
MDGYVARYSLRFGVQKPDLRIWWPVFSPNIQRRLPFSHVLLRSFDTKNTAFQFSKPSDGRLLLSNKKSRQSVIQTNY